MILKKIPEDFIVEELFDLEKFKEGDEGRKNYFYFILKKKNYSQIRAIEKVAKIFNTSKKLINFAGTKDKVGITSGLISIYNLNQDNLEKNLKFLNNNVDDIDLEFVGIFRRRINLGDNNGNRFIITIRDLEEVDFLEERIEGIKLNGILNYFDDQRFGYANNSHIVGKYVLKNEIELALKEVLTSCPKNGSEDLKFYTDFIRNNWNGIRNQDENILKKIKEIIPKFLINDLKSIEHIYKYKNDFPGAFKKINKKIRTLYVNAYQSYIFNEILNRVDSSNIPNELELINEGSIFEDEIKEIVNEILEKDGVKIEDFKLKSMPELKLKKSFRKTRISPKNIKVLEKGIDDLSESGNSNKFKVVISFELGPGEYATNVVKEIFKNL